MMSSIISIPYAGLPIIATSSPMLCLDFDFKFCSLLGSISILDFVFDSNFMPTSCVSKMRSLLFLALIISVVVGSCQCQRDNCGCCEHASWKRVKFSGDVCLNITYYPKSLTLSLDLTLINNLDNKTTVVFNKTVSATSPNICFGVPYLHKLASLCLDFSNVTYAKTGISGCAKVELKILGFNIDGVKLGCFDIHTLIDQQSVDLNQESISDLNQSGEEEKDAVTKKQKANQKKRHLIQ